MLRLPNDFGVWEEGILRLHPVLAAGEENTGGAASVMQPVYFWVLFGGGWEGRGSSRKGPVWLQMQEKVRGVVGTSQIGV